MSTGIIYENIKACRVKKGLSQLALAEKAAINLRTLQRIESGQTAPRGQTLHLIADALDMPLEYFMSDDKQTTPGDNRRFLQLVTLSCLSFWAFPFANIFIPLLLLHFKKDTVTGVEAFITRVISIQKKWCFITYGIILIAMLSAIIHPQGLDPLFPFYCMIAVAISYIGNSILIIIKVIQIRHDKKLPGTPVFAS